MIDTRKNIEKFRNFAAELRSDRSGLALVEFAISLPFFMGLAVAGLETANYAATTMQVNQIVRGLRLDGIDVARPLPLTTDARVDGVPT